MCAVQGGEGADTKASMVGWYAVGSPTTMTEPSSLFVPIRSGMCAVRPCCVCFT
jgi:hypothetical protein